MSSKVWDEITYPFPNVNGCTGEVWDWISNFIPMDAITMMLGSKLIQVSKSGYWYKLFITVSTVLITKNRDVQFQVPLATDDIVHI